MKNRIKIAFSLLSILFVFGCSSSQVQSVAKTMRGLTGGDHSRAAFLEPSVKEALDHEMRVCLDGEHEDVDLRAKCIQIAYDKVKAQKGLDKELDLGGEVIVEQIDENAVIDRTTEEKPEEDGKGDQ